MILRQFYLLQIIFSGLVWVNMMHAQNTIVTAGGEAIGGGGQSDWYLPALDELHLLFQNRYNVNRSLSIIVGAEPLPLLNMTMASK